MKISSLQPYIYKPAQRVAFSGYHAKISTKCDEVPMGSLCHMTKFYRYPEIDSLAVKKLKSNFPKEKLKILSAGCSYGEEVYTLAMMCENKGVKAEITGIDISPEVIKEAKNGCYELERSEYSALNKGLKNFPRRRMFHKNFHSIGYFFPNCTDKRFLQWGTGACYQKNDDSFQNCDFRVGNIAALDEQFEENSLNAVFMRNVVYHFCKQLNTEENSDIQNVFKQIDKVLKPGGLLVLAPYEMEVEMYKCNTLKDDMNYICLNPFNGNSIFQKPKE